MMTGSVLAGMWEQSEETFVDYVPFLWGHKLADTAASRCAWVLRSVISMFHLDKMKVSGLFHQRSEHECICAHKVNLNKVNLQKYRNIWKEMADICLTICVTWRSAAGSRMLRFGPTFSWKEKVCFLIIRILIKAIRATQHLLEIHG